MPKKQTIFTLDGSSKRQEDYACIFFYKDSVEVKELSASELKCEAPHDPATLMRDVNLFARNEGFAGGFPTYASIGTGYGRSIEVALVPHEIATFIQQGPPHFTGSERRSAIHDIFRTMYNCCEAHAMPTFITEGEGETYTHAGLVFNPQRVVYTVVQDSTENPLRDDIVAMLRWANDEAKKRGYEAGVPTCHGSGSTNLHHCFNTYFRMRHMVENEGWRVASITPLGVHSDKDGNAHFAATYVLEKDEDDDNSLSPPVPY